MSYTERFRGAGRLLAAVLWVALLLALWQWGASADVQRSPAVPTTGDMAAVGPAQDHPDRRAELPGPAVSAYLTRTGP